MSLYYMCGIAYRNKYVEKIEEPQNTNLVRGNAGHAAIEAALRHKQQTGDLLPLDEALEIFSMTWHDKEDSIELVGKQQQDERGKEAILEEVKLNTIAMVTALYNNVLQNIDPVEVEADMLIEIEGLDVPLMAKIDCITKQGDVIDWKFKGKTPPENAIANDIQFTLYNLAYLTEYGVQPNQLVMGYAVDLKKEKTADIRVAPHRDDDTLNRAVRRMQTFVKGVQNDIFLPASENSFKCMPGQCAHWSYCNHRP
jgi:hypothetical protein